MPATPEQCRARYHRLRAAGKCVKCMGDAKGMAICMPCRMGRSRLYRARYQRLRETGACTWCARPIGEGTLCAEHRARKRGLPGIDHYAERRVG